MRKIKVIQYGCGKMGKYLLKYLHEKGAQIVGAIDSNPELEGKNIGEIADIENDSNINISLDAEKVFKECDADVCVIATKSLVTDVYEAFELAAKHGVNAISTCEEALYSWNTSPKLSNKLDKLAQKNNCTLTGSGYQDVYWGNLITTLAGSSHKITKIEGVSNYNVEDYGIALAEVHGAGLSLEEFDKEIAQSDSLPSFMWNSNEWLCSQFGWTIKSINQKLVPTTHEKDIHSQTLDKVIPAGNATGMAAIVTTVTNQGPVIKSKCVGKVYAEGDNDRNDWIIKGEPDINVEISQPKTSELTCATIVNRIPQLIKSPSGYYTTEKMPPAKYRTYPLHLYL